MKYPFKFEDIEELTGEDRVRTRMEVLDNDYDDDTYNVWKNGYLTELEKWKTEMEKIEI